MGCGGSKKSLNDASPTKAAQQEAKLSNNPSSKNQEQQILSQKKPEISKPQQPQSKNPSSAQKSAKEEKSLEPAKKAAASPVPAENSKKLLNSHEVPQKGHGETSIDGHLSEGIRSNKANLNNTYEALKDRSPQPCTLGDAQGVAMAFYEPGTTLSPLPFRHPELLDREIQINVTHVGCCHSDVFMATQAWFPGVHYPLVPGHEIVGIVDKIGEKVTKYQPGDKVGFGVLRDCCEQYDSCLHCRTGNENYCPKRVGTYDPHFGGYATSFQAKGNFFYKLDDSFPGEAAPLFCAGMTVFPPLQKDVVGGMKVGVVGIGGLGHLALKFARAMGTEVTAISTSSSKETDAKEFGAHHFINLKDEKQVKNGIGSLDYIINTATSYDIGQCCSLLKPRRKFEFQPVSNSY
ncbi:unnamed protein product [Blepharisma stoltei]|uniref:Uncharacterized protein n=1 Tax=Blepharisma stoltei TaxID=1481888 RepID=A0AAU9JTA5_9CILI|nr:unnamed protein product [Blepharisma stoltei]